MTILIPTPSDHNHTTEVFKRTLSSASFLCNAQDSVAMHKTKKTKRKGRWLYRTAIVLACGAALIALTGCHNQKPAPTSKESTAAKRACGKMTPVWIEANTIECVKETL